MLRLAVFPKKMIHTGDNLAIMRDIDQESVDLIYLDPPFNTRVEWSSRYNPNQKFTDVWKAEDVRKEDILFLEEKNPNLRDLVDLLHKMNGGAWLSYSTYMALRLIEMERILKKTGSIYLHCDLRMSHPLKLIMDNVFKGKNFRNEISNERNDTKPGKGFHKQRDVILYYSKGENFTYRSVYEDAEPPKSMQYQEDEKGQYYIEWTVGRGGGRVKDFDEWKGFVSPTGFYYTKERMQQFEDEGLMVYMPDGEPRFKKYWNGRVCSNSWYFKVKEMTKDEKTGYPTQKPIALLERIIKASSNQGDLVFDPFCGSGTTLVAAKNLGRKYIGIDVSEEATKLAKQRTEK